MTATALARTDAPTTRAAIVATPHADQLEPQSIEQAMLVAGFLHKSGLMPPHIKSPEAAFAIIMTGRGLGLSAMQSVRALHMVEGKVAASADLMVALAKNHPACEYFRIVEATDERVTCETKRRGDSQPSRITWTIDDAKRAGLLSKQNWAKYPRAMLRARASSELARAVYPDAAMGIYDSDELPAPREAAQAPPTVTVVPEPVNDIATAEEAAVDAQEQQQAADKKARALMAAMRKCATTQDVAGVAAKVVEAKAKGLITQKHRDAIAHVYEDVMRKILANPPAEQPAGEDGEDRPTIHRADPETGEVA